MTVNGRGKWNVHRWPRGMAWGGEKKSWIKIVTGHIIIGIGNTYNRQYIQDFSYFRGGTCTLSLSSSVA